MRKIMPVIMSAVIVIMSVLGAAPLHPQKASAKKENTYSVYYSEYSASITNRCIDFQDYLTNIGTKQYGLLYSLRILSQYCLYVHFMDTYYKELNIDSKSVSMYEQDLREEIDNFNARFSKKSKDYECLKLEVNFTGVWDSNTKNGSHHTAKEDIEKIVVETIPSYMNKSLKIVEDKITEARGDITKVKKIKADNTTLLTNIYSIYTYTLEAKADLATFTPFTSSGKHKTYDVSYKDKTLKAALQDSIKDYDDLVQVAKDQLASEQTDEDIALDLSLSYADNLSDAVTKSTGVEIPKSPSLSRLYYAIMAASSVYVPLQSYTGSSEFQAALKSLTNDDTVQKQMVEFYSSVKDIRKPLYKRELDDKGIPTGTATLLTIQSFFDDIREGNSGALCSVLGKFSYSETSNSWLYYQDDTRNTSSSDYGNIENNQDSSVNTSDSVDDSSWGDVKAEEEEENDNFGDSEVEPNLIGEKDLSILDRILSPISKTASATSPTASPEKDKKTEEEETEENRAGTAVGSDSKKDNEETIDDTAVFAYSEITDETKLTDVQYFYGCDYQRDVDNMTFAIMNNILKSSSNLQYISDKSTRYLYINTFGDIVTDDNLVIFPGIANPLIYRSEIAYNPYTSAFLNFYPSAYRASSKFKLTNKNSIGKYLIAKQTSSKSSEILALYSLKTQSIDSVKSTAPLINKDIYLDFTVDGTQMHRPFKYRRLIFGADSSWNENNAMYLYTPLVYDAVAQIGGVNVFPYVVHEDVNYNIAKAIASNMYWYLTTDAGTNKKTDVHKLNDNYIIHNFIVSGVNGTNNPKGYAANVLEQYEKYVENSQNRFLSKILDLSETLISSLSSVQGVIGFRESLQSPILGRVLSVCKQNIVFFFLIIAIMLLIAFNRMKIDRFQLVVKFIICMLVSYFSITVIPAYLPMLFNIVINNVSEDLSYKILATQIEKDSIGEKDAVLDKDGSVRMNTDSITVYRAGTLNYQEFINNVNVDEDELIAGSVVVMNQEAGLFAEGDSLKINTHSLYDTLKIVKDMSKKTDSENSDIVASTTDSGADDVYKLKAYKTVSNNLDYYAPFYQIVDSFIGQMNKLQEIMNIPRSIIVYSNGTIKDNFLVYSYVNSSVFLTPGSYREDYNLEELPLDEQEDFSKETDAIAAKLEKTFGDESRAADFLGLSSWLLEPTEEMQKTLWYKSMVENGYYDKTTGKPHKRRINNLITKVNNVTKDFVFDMDSLVGQVSDETMIELISTRAMVALCQEISEFGHWVYPFSLNYGDFSLKEVADAVFISNYDKFVTMNLNVVDYVGYTDGWFNLIGLDILIVILFILAWVIQTLVPLLYLLLCITLIMKLMAQGEGKVSVKGFAKCSLIIVVCHTLIVAGLALSEKSNGSVISIYLMLGACILVAYILTIVVTSVVSDWANVGNNAISVKMQKAFNMGNLLNRIKNIRVNNIKAGSFSRDRRYGRNGWQGRNDYGGYNGYGNYGSRYDMYRYDASVDDFYTGNSYYSPYEETNYDTEEQHLDDPGTDYVYDELPITSEDTQIEDIDELPVNGEEKV